MLLTTFSRWLNGKPREFLEDDDLRKVVFFCANKRNLGERGLSDLVGAFLQTDNSLAFPKRTTLCYSPMGASSALLPFV
jgi:hypothetical protein